MQPDRARNNGGRTMELVAAAPSDIDKVIHFCPSSMTSYTATIRNPSSAPSFRAFGVNSFKLHRRAVHIQLQYVNEKNADKLTLTVKTVEPHGDMCSGETGEGGEVTAMHTVALELEDVEVLSITGKSSYSELSYRKMQALIYRYLIQ
ncbi:hypothetical protein STEG23_014382, partial [Scotinomys teguina]